MSRKRVYNQKRISPDPVFSSKLLSKFVNVLMFNGKKSIAEKIVYSAIRKVSLKFNKSPLEILETTIENVKPIVEIKSRRVGGSTYQVPVEIRSVRRNTLAIRWIIESARKRKEKSMKIRLENELIDVMENKGAAIKKRDDIHRMADANKAFAHYRW